MESNFTSGLVVGIIISVIFFSIISSDDKPQNSAPAKSSYSSSGSYNNSYSGYRDYDSGSDYDSYGLHERGFH